jgi:hypothetical protein
LTQQNLFNYNDIEFQEVQANTTYQNLLAISKANIFRSSTLANLIPVADAIESFTPTSADLFFDPGGMDTDGAPGNYPNC